MPPTPEDRGEIREGSSGNPLRDFMLKTPDSNQEGPQPGPSREPRIEGHPFSKVSKTCFRDTSSHDLYSFVKTLLGCLFSSMIFGDGGHRKLLKRSTKETEVKNIFQLIRRRKTLWSFWTSQSLTNFPLSPDLDSAVSSGGLDQILSPPAARAPSQPRIRSFFQSVTVTKVVKPDGVRISCPF